MSQEVRRRGPCPQPPSLRFLSSGPLGCKYQKWALAALQGSGFLAVRHPRVPRLWVSFGLWVCRSGIFLTVTSECGHSSHGSKVPER